MGIVAVHVNSGQTLSLWIIANQHPRHKSKHKANHGGEPKSNLPSFTEERETSGDQKTRERTTNVMCGIPERNLRPALAR